MTPNILTAISTLTETENKNNNIQITKQSRKQKTKQNKTKTNQNHKKKQTAKHTHKKKYSKSFTTMKSRPDTALTDFTSKLKGYLLHKCNVLLQKITCWTPVSGIFFPSFNFV